MTFPSDLAPPHPDLAPGEVPEQLELLDPYDDGLDFGTWIENLPLRPDASERRHG